MLVKAQWFSLDASEGLIFLFDVLPSTQQFGSGTEQQEQ